ncbi:hypothetical protein ACP70R_043980 [Stipagrostis hirtigluma subsp. patula]
MYGDGGQRGKGQGWQKVLNRGKVREMAIDSDGDLHGGGDSGGGAKRPRMDEQGDQRQAAADGAVEVDRISVLPDELRYRVLALLPLKAAIRTGALARRWRDLWKSRWTHRSSVDIHLRSSDDIPRELDALEREPRPRRRLERFSLIVGSRKLKPSELRRFLDYATECGAEDLHVGVDQTLRRFNFHLPLSSPRLARLSLRRMSIASVYYYKRAQTFQALEVIMLHSVSVAESAFKKMMALCPSLRTLDLRHCSGDLFALRSKIILPENLRSVTFVECAGDKIRLDTSALPRLRSFRYGNRYCLSTFSLPVDAALAELYIIFPQHSPLFSDLFGKALPHDLSGLTVLTLCSNALKIASSMSGVKADAQLAKFSKLPNLRELQLVMRDMNRGCLSDIYMFIKACQCPNLERLFVQLPVMCMRSVYHQVAEESPQDGLGKLTLVKVTGFNWCCSDDVELVVFLLKKASSLKKMLLDPGWPILSLVPLNNGPDVGDVPPLNVPGVEEADLLLFKEAVSTGKIVLEDRESDDVATQPFHSESLLCN